MKRDQDTAAPPSKELPPSAERCDAGSTPEPSDPEPSDPDAAMYAAIAARPKWIEKPIVQQLIKELSEGLGPGEDILYWDMRRPRPARPSDAEEHRTFTLPRRAGGLSDTLPSARVIVQDPAHAGRPSPGRNGPRAGMDGASEVSPGHPRTASQRPPPGSVPRWCLAAVFFGVALLSAAFTLLVLHLGKGDRSLAPTAPAALSSPSCGAARR